MKKKTDIPTVDPLSEELKTLAAELSERGELQAQEADFDAFLAATREEVDTYSLTGDLKDQKGLAAIVVKRLQAELSAARAGKVEQRLEEIDARLAVQVETTRRLMLSDLHAVSNGLVEKAARDMEKHFPSLGDARKQAFHANAVIQNGIRIHSLSNDHFNAEPAERAANYLKLAPAIANEVRELEKQLGGRIPSEHQLRGNEPLFQHSKDMPSTEVDKAASEN